MVFKTVITFIILCWASFASGQQSPILWTSFEDLAQLQAAEKVIIVYIHSTWCDKCKVMEETTLVNEKITKYVNSRLIAISLDAQEKSDIIFKHRTFRYSKSLGKGYNELALELTKERLILPSTVILDKDFNIIQSIPGLKTSEELYPILVYFGESHYNTTPWKIFKQRFN